MNNIIPFTGITYADIPVDDVLAGAKECKFQSVVVIGLTEDGEIMPFYSIFSVPEINWMLDIAKQQILMEPEE